ncbi:NAD(P)(+) transhydrogenase (Re/Si-specific) subunit beta [Paraburkholderia phosphatilytica]|uniref:NAD(P)(+) transhydrogenase (Re/Si-specific) subunit beta n=1 Tax=Paraburkholderia phosphatilytica TaxID=2282883 RepID=UPI000E4C57B1|nr:NAD(P)(+) transhydrogenase (Re/Si-specific) subunit beta [Paraburkholderia phosphatilytica]
MTDLSDLMRTISAPGSVAGAGIGLLCALVLGATAQLLAAHDVARQRRPRAWRRALLAATGAMLAGWLAAGIGGGLDAIVAATCAAGATVGYFVRRDLSRRLARIALVGCASGAAALGGGLLRYVVSRTHADALFRFELCGAVFLGALIFAASAIALARLQGVLRRRYARSPGVHLHSLDFLLLDAFAFVLCAWLAWGFVTEHTAPAGTAALFAIGALAAALGVHLTMAFDGWPAQALTARALRVSARHCGALRDSGREMAVDEWWGWNPCVEPGGGHSSAAGGGVDLRASAKECVAARGPSLGARRASWQASWRVSGELPARNTLHVRPASRSSIGGSSNGNDGNNRRRRSRAAQRC